MYRPAGYDDSDEDEYDDYGFITSASPYTKKKYSPVNVAEQTPTEDYDTLLYNAVLDGNLDEVKRVLHLDSRLRSGECLRQGWPILFYACYEAKLEIVEYLVLEERIDVQRSHNLQTALMVACSSTHPSESVYPVVRVLLEHGAIIGVLDRYGCSPLMVACREGHLEVVKEIVGESSLLSVDNDGNTALFHAVNNNHSEIVKVLLRAGAQTHIVNREGYTPRQCAINRNYMHIADLLPLEEECYELPAKYMTYNSYRNFIHGEAEQDPPEYFPELGLMLFGMDSETNIRFFAQQNMGLFELLTATDDRLREIGVKYPIERKRILLGLYDLHRHPWSKNSLGSVPKQQAALDCYGIQEALGNLLKQLTVIHASLLYTKQLAVTRHAAESCVDVMRMSPLAQKLQNLRSMIHSFETQMADIDKLSSPSPVLHIPKQESAQRATCNAKVIKIGICLMIGSFAMYLKLKK